MRDESSCFQLTVCMTASGFIYGQQPMHSHQRVAPTLRKAAAASALPCLRPGGRKIKECIEIAGKEAGPQASFLWFSQ
jgi:hypothetical protein